MVSISNMLFLIWAIFLGLGWVCSVLEDGFKAKRRYGSIILFSLSILAILAGIFMPMV